MQRIKLVVLIGIATMAVLGGGYASSASAKVQILELRTTAGPVEMGEQVAATADEVTVETSLGNLTCFATTTSLNGALQTNSLATDELAVFESTDVFAGKENCENLSSGESALLTIGIKGSSGGLQYLGSFHLTSKGKIEFKPGPGLDVHLHYTSMDCYYTFAKWKGPLAGINEARFLSYDFVKQKLKPDKVDSSKACPKKVALTFDGGFKTLHHGYASALARSS
jgi:hypothetical protein